uniref:50S ribosomal protein L20 n=1 Tax=Cyanidium sp. THAL103 TaxID=3027999 RepID=A0A9Y1I3Z8_9RHOD|nr:ribosomal protein L20 [Cyanidium sp. THAL103]
MVRIKRGNVSRKRHKKILKLSKGFVGSHSKLFRVANQQVMKSLRYSYIGRKRKKRDFRKLWIIRLNAAVRGKGITYNSFMHKLKLSKISINRKMLSQISILDSINFAKIYRNII